MNSHLPYSKFDRQERLSIWNQSLIEGSCVLIGGIGGTGGEVAKNLSLLGVITPPLATKESPYHGNFNHSCSFTLITL